MSIPVGFCQCGCGQPTRRALCNNTRAGWVKGEFTRYIKGHNGRGISTTGQESRAARWTKTLEERFWDKVDRRRSLILCWPWKAATNGRGYGQINVDGKPKKAHRVAWELTHGPIPEGMEPLHKCDNPLCQRPSHLMLGTQADNIRDRFAKKRRGIYPKGCMPSGDQHWTRRRAASR